MNKYFFAILIAFLVSCQKSKEYRQIQTALYENMELQRLHQRKLIEDQRWKARTGEPVRLAETCLHEFVAVKNSLMGEDITRYDSLKIDSVNRYMQSWHKLYAPTTPKVNSTSVLVQKIELLNRLYHTGILAADIHEWGCGWGWGMGSRPLMVLVPRTDKPDKKYAFEYFEPDSTQPGTVSIHCRSGKKYVFRIPKTTTHKEALTFSIPMYEELLALEWADSNTYNGLKRHFTWPNYTGY